MFANSVADILKSKTARGLPRELPIEKADIASLHQGLDNFHKVFAIRPGDHVVMLTDPLLDPRVIQAVYGLAKARGATFASFMGATTQLLEVPDEAKPALDRATFVVSTWFASVIDPYCIKLRAEKGQRWVKITFFRNYDLLQAPQARFPLDVLGEIIRATARLYPTSGDFDMRFSDTRGTNFEIKFTKDMRDTLLKHNRWRGHNVADEAGCYIHFIPIHGPNLYEPYCWKGPGNAPINGVIFPQWAPGFEKPFEEKIAVEMKDDRVVAVHGRGMEAEVMRDLCIGGKIEELGCGHNPKWPRFDIYPAGPNSPGGLHFGINGAKPSEYFRRVMPNWEEPHVHLDLVTFDTTVTAGNQTILDRGFLKSLRDPAVVKAASKYGDPIDLLEAFPM